MTLSYQRWRATSPSPHSSRHYRATLSRRLVAALLLLAPLAACDDGPTAPSPESGGTSTRWNALSRELVIADRAAPPIASRAYAYVSVAQYAAALAAHGFRPGTWSLGAAVTPIVGLAEAAIATASARMLTVMFPSHAARLQRELTADHAALRERGIEAHVVERGVALGTQIAASLERRARDDRSNIAWTGSAPNGAGYWAGAAPQLPAWGQVQPWLWEAGSELRAPPPPPFDSDEFRAALAEVQQIAAGRTPEQMEIARFWADGAGTHTPPGHWNEIASALVGNAAMNEMQSARTLAAVNVAMMDAIIACWDSKFTYWVVRPYQANPAISTPIGQPPHPSYPSGHACSSGAAAAVLSHVFPAQAANLERMALEACDSRVYAGIHYRFDAEAGMTIGTAAGERAFERVDRLVLTEVARAVGAVDED